MWGIFLISDLKSVESVERITHRLLFVAVFTLSGAGTSEYSKKYNKKTNKLLLNKKVKYTKAQTGWRSVNIETCHLRQTSLGRERECDSNR